MSPWNLEADRMFTMNRNLLIRLIIKHKVGFMNDSILCVSNLWYAKSLVSLYTHKSQSVCVCVSNKRNESRNIHVVSNVSLLQKKTNLFLLWAKLNTHTCAIKQISETDVKQTTVSSVLANNLILLLLTLQISFLHIHLIWVMMFLEAQNKV